MRRIVADGFPREVELAIKLVYQTKLGFVLGLHRVGDDDAPDENDHE
jgi:hypothetical protein